MTGPIVKAVASRIAWFFGYVVVATLGLAFYEFVTEDPVNRQVLESGVSSAIGVAIGVEIVRWMQRRREQRGDGGRE